MEKNEICAGFHAYIFAELANWLWTEYIWKGGFTNIISVGEIT